MDRLAAMAAFVRVVDAGSFSGAAKQLRIGQPAVSKTIAQLEDRLGARLLLRSTHRLTPTEAGRSFYERAKRAIEEADEAELAARRRRSFIGPPALLRSPILYTPARAAASCDLPRRASGARYRCCSRRPRHRPDCGRHRCGAAHRPSQRFSGDRPQNRTVPKARDRYARLFSRRRVRRRPRPTCSRITPSSTSSAMAAQPGPSGKELRKPQLA